MSLLVPILSIEFKCHVVVESISFLDFDPVLVQRILLYYGRPKCDLDFRLELECQVYEVILVLLD